MRMPFLSIALLSAVLPATAAEPPYLDDRSNPGALIESLYNAITRKEYARAWSYFSEKPAESLDVYAEGYADTASVRVAVGIPSEHGAAGTIHYYVPVAIEASAGDGGNYQVYGGCYELKLANPQIQGEDFTPLNIVSGRLSAATGSLEDALPETCDDVGPPDPALLYEQRATALFHDAFSHCDIPPDTPAAEALNSYVARFKFSYSSASEPEEERRIFRFLCGRGAYNEGHVYIMADGIGEMKALSFATPELDIRYVDAEHEKVESMSIIGFRTEQELVNSFFDPDTLTITSYAKWRGVGDASSTGMWILRDGEFTLTRYDVDASYDGQINEETVLDYHSGP
jgi:hypothetical protein